MSEPFLAVSYFFHLIATVVWIGGLIILAVLVIPEARRALAESPALEAFMMRLRRRFTPLTNLSLAVLVLTGMFQMSGDPNYEGLLAFNNSWSVAMLLKHVAVVGMVVGGVALQFGVIPALERAALLAERGKGDAAARERLRRRESRLTWANIALGVVVLACTAWATAV